MLSTRTSMKDKVSNGAGHLVTNARQGSRKVADFAVEHKAMTVAGVIALGAIGLGVYALMRTRSGR